MSARYYIGAVEQTFLRRIVRTKTFYLASSVFLTSVAGALEGTVGWKVALIGGLTSAAMVVVRDAIAKAELAANATNQSVTNVVATDK